MLRIQFPPSLPSGLTFRESVRGWVDGYSIFCLLIGQAVLFNHIPTEEEGISHTLHCMDDEIEAQRDSVTPKDSNSSSFSLIQTGTC